MNGNFNGTFRLSDNVGPFRVVAEAYSDSGALSIPANTSFQTVNPLNVTYSAPKVMALGDSILTQIKVSSLVSTGLTCMFTASDSANGEVLNITVPINGLPLMPSKDGKPSIGIANISIDAIDLADYPV